MIPQLKAGRLTSQVQAVCPILGLSVGTTGVSASVRLDFDPVATGAQQTSAQNVVNAFDWSDAADLTFIAQQYKAAATAGIDMGALQAGDKFERLCRAVVLIAMDEINILRAAIPHPVVSITRVTTVGTVTTLDPHGLNTGDSVRIMGATLAAYNVAAVVTVTNSTVFTYAVAGSPVTPAVGSIFFAMGVIPAAQPRTAAQLVTAVKAKIAATAE